MALSPFNVTNAVASLSDVETTERWLGDNDIEGYQHGGPLLLDTQVGREGGAKPTMPEDTGFAIGI